MIPDNGSNGEETDDRPSTFWMTNPTNTWVGNVAAGSEDNGFWLELRTFVRGPQAAMYPDLNPRKSPLTLFKENVAHSNRNVSDSVVMNYRATSRASQSLFSGEYRKGYEHIQMGLSLPKKQILLIVGHIVIGRMAFSFTTAGILQSKAVYLQTTMNNSILIGRSTLLFAMQL